MQVDCGHATFQYIQWTSNYLLCLMFSIQVSRLSEQNISDIAHIYQYIPVSFDLKISADTIAHAHVLYHIDHYLPLLCLQIYLWFGEDTNIRP